MSLAADRRAHSLLHHELWMEELAEKFALEAATVTIACSLKSELLCRRAGVISLNRANSHLRISDHLEGGRTHVDTAVWALLELAIIPILGGNIKEITLCLKRKVLTQ